MTLSEIRNMAKERSGRYDLVNSDGSDNGMDHFIRTASSFLDGLVDTDALNGWDRAVVSSGDMVAELSPRVRNIIRAFVHDGSTKSELAILRNPKDMLDLYAVATDSIDKARPNKASIVSVRQAERIRSILGTPYRTNYSMRNISDPLLAGWYENNVTRTVVTDEGEKVAKIQPIVGQDYLATIALANVDYNVPYIVEFWAKGYGLSNTIAVAYGIDSTATAISNPPLSGEYQKYIFKTDRISDINILMYLDLIVINFFGVDAPSSTDLYVLVKDMVVRVDDKQDTYVKSADYHKPLMLYPPADGEYTIEAYCRLASDKLESDTDENFWSVNYPELLVLATCYQLEAALRNTQGMNDWMNAMQGIIRGIQADYYEQDLDILDKMEG